VVAVRSARHPVIPMHSFRCTRCGAGSYSAASLERLSAGNRCSHCGGELESTASPRLFGARRRGPPQPVAEAQLGDLRRPA
jgi:DNA-directed RNA polymerase subunit RPC12/RpoP